MMKHNERQYGFIKGRSTDTALSMLVKDIEKALFQQKDAVGVFLDISGAFDNLSYEAIKTALIAHYYPEQYVSWYTNYLQDRIAVIDVKGVSKKICLTKGTPQGGVLSPIAWNLVFDEFLDLFRGSAISPRGYADDVALIIAGSNISYMKNTLQMFLEKTYDWGNSKGLKFCPTKTQSILFLGKPSVHLPLPYSQWEGCQLTM